MSEEARRALPSPPPTQGVLGSTEDRLAFLALAGERLSSSLDLKATLKNLGRLVVPMLADRCAIDLLEEDGRLRRAHTSYVGASREEVDADEANAEPVMPDSARSSVSLIHAPLMASGRSFGVLTLSITASGRRYGQGDLDIAEDIARRAAIAIANARLHEGEQTAREDAERAVDRTMRLHRLTSSLAVAATPLQVAEAALHQGMSAVDASAAALAVRTRDKTVTVVLARGFAQGALSRGTRLDPEGPRVLAFTSRSGQPLWLENERALAEVTPALSLELLETGPPAALACIPMASVDKLSGAIAFYFREPHVFSVEERSFLATLTRQTTGALDRARLLETAQRDKAASEISSMRLVALQRMTEQLSGQMERVKVAEIIVDHVREMFADCKALVATLSKDGKHLDCVRAHGHTRETLERHERMDLASPSPIADAVRTKTSIFFDSPKAFAEQYPRLAGSGLEPPPKFVAAVPFMMEDRPLGGLLLRIYDTNRAVGGDQDFITYLSRVCGHSLERARLYELEREARAEAETDRKRLELLVDTSSAINTSLDKAEILEAIARVTVPSFASYCIVCDLTEAGEPRVVSVVHEDPAIAALIRTMRARYPFGPNHPIAEVLQTHKPVLRPIINEAHDRKVALDDEHFAMLRKIKTTSSFVLPILARDRIFGVLSFGKASGHFTTKDFALGEELARRTAFALENARLYNEAQEANRLKDQFLGLVSHELRTPLNAIVGWAFMLRSKALPEPQKTRAVESIQHNSRELARLVDDLLDVSRILAGKLELEPCKLDLEASIERAIQTVSHAASAKEIEVLFQAEDRPVEVFADPNRIQQIVWNLLSNAIKFTPRKGRIELTLRRSGEGAEILVKDTGQGISPDFLPHAFEAFRQEDGSLTREKSGLGLGLSIVRRFVEAHGGTVSAESPGRGQGSTFTVRLPLGAAKPPPSLPPLDHRAESCMLSGIRVLVVDDEPDALEMVVALLRNAGATVYTATDVPQALTAIIDSEPHVLVSDLAMPGEDGFSLIKKVRMRERGRNEMLPAIALTALARPEDRVKALSAGYQMHAPKPVNPTELVAMIASLRGLLR